MEPTKSLLISQLILWCISFLFGLGFAPNEKTVKIVAIFNVSYTCWNAFCQIIAFYFPSSLLQYSSYNFITIFTKFNQIYILGIGSCLISLKVFTDRLNLLKIQKYIATVSANLSKPEVPQIARSLQPFIIASTNFFLVLLMSMLEISRHEFDFFALWALYVPGSILILYVTCSMVFIHDFQRFFTMMNNYLETLLIDHPSGIDQINAVLALRPKPQRDVSRINEIVLENFSVLTKCLDCFNNFYGLIYVLFFYMTISTSICVFYSLNIQVPDQEGVSSNFADYFWAGNFIVVMLGLAAQSQAMKNEADKTMRILYRFVNIYSAELNEQILVNAQQLNHQKMKVSAANLFEVDFSIVGGVHLLIGVYVMVFYQMDSGVK